MKNITTSVYSFENMIKGNFLYVDKTAIIYKLVEQPSGIFFISRPRRFGKSLTLSTLKYIFQGRRDLFKGLAIDSLDYDWKVYPVIHLDMARICKNTPSEFYEALMKKVNEIAVEYEVCVPEFSSPKDGFDSLIKQLSKIDKVVILIDEYDKPILDNIGEKNIDEYRKILDSFYEVIKGCEEYERFVFMTGVTKVSKVSIFSKLNNLKDITMSANYATLMGYTQDEFENNFTDRLDDIVKKKELNKLQFISDIKGWYNGFRFHKDAPTIYNPVSVGNFFEENGEFRNYWFATATPSFLMKLLKRKHFDFENALIVPQSELVFDNFDLDTMTMLPLLIQTGYLTICGFKIRSNQTFYNFGFPNKEVEISFSAYLLDALTNAPKTEVANVNFELCDAIIAGDTEGFVEKMKWFFADLPYELHIKLEKYYQTVFYTVLRNLRFEVQTEVSTNRGRIDAVITLEDRIYLFEFKLDDTKENALEQILERKYYEKYMDKGLPIHLIGVGFDYKERNISGYIEKMIN